MWRKDIIYSAKIKSWKISYKQGGGDLFVFGNFGKKRNLKVEIMQFPNLELLDQGHFFQSLRGGVVLVPPFLEPCWKPSWDIGYHAFISFLSLS